MRLAHLALKWPYPGGTQVALDLVKCAADGDLGMAMELAYEYLANVRMERTRAEAAVEFLDLMAILRMLRRFDAGEVDRLREALDTPDEREDIETIADHWLSTLAEQEERAQAIIQQIAVMIDAAVEPGHQSV